MLATLEALGPRSQQELATGLSVNRTVMVKLIDGLEARGFVERVRNPHDRRAYALHATPAGPGVHGRDAAADAARRGGADREPLEPASTTGSTRCCGR